MYLKHYALSETPFSIAPDPRYLFLSERHREALAHLVYGIRSDGGFILLTGEVGTGKTTVCRCLLEQLPERTDVALVLNPRLSARELLATLCDELAVPYPRKTRSIKELVDAINLHLLQSHASGRRAVVIIDEAQNLSPQVLEQVRLLTNLETNRSKLLQVILIGQPELRTLLERPELRQLSQRITARYHLEALSRTELEAYVAHRLKVAGRTMPLFTPRALAELYRNSGGVPRLVNVICDRALLGGYALGRDRIDHTILARAAREVFGEEKRRRRAFLPRMAIALAIFAAVGAGLSALDLRPPTGARQVSSVAPSEKAPFEIPAAADAAAFESLFELWGAHYDPSGAPPCEQAESQGLSCLEDRGSLGSLLSLNRPAILTLLPPGAEPGRALLTRLEPMKATLQDGEKTTTLPAAELSRVWRGEFVLLWQPPDFYRTPLREGDMGAGSAWLNDRLLELSDSSGTDRGKEVFDAATTAAVKAFQRSRGLSADGIVGPRTLVHLDTLPEREGPSLVSRGD